MRLAVPALAPAAYPRRMDGVPHHAVRLDSARVIGRACLLQRIPAKVDKVPIGNLRWLTANISSAFPMVVTCSAHEEPFLGTNAVATS
jgi:hypothetical protein